MYAWADGSIVGFEPGVPPSFISYTLPISTTEHIDWLFGITDSLRAAVTDGQAKTTRFVDIPSDKDLFSQYSPWSMTMSPDGRRLAFANTEIEIRDASNGKLLSILPGHSTSVKAVAFNPDNRWLASGSADLTVKVWEVESGNLISTFNTPAVPAALAWSLDGKRLGAGLTDGSLTIWDVDPASPTTGQALYRFTGIDAKIDSIGFSPDGKIVYAGSSLSNQTRMYLLPLEDLVKLAKSRLTRSWTAEECQRYRIEPCP